MRDLNEDTVTTEVIARIGGARSLRIKRISEAFVRHIHAFIKEVQPTESEWLAGIEFLTQTGRMCDEKRQEFILLSDALGISTLVDAINHRLSHGATETAVLGPFYVGRPREFALGADLSAGVAGQPMIVTGQVASPDGRVLASATVDIWHADGGGFYDVQQFDQPAMRGRFKTDATGRFWFWTIKPRWYPIPHDGPVGRMLAAQGRHPNRPAHVHFMIFADGHETLVTQVFEKDGPYLDSDAVFGVKSSLVSPFSVCAPGPAPDGREMPQPYIHLHYDFILKPVAKALGGSAA